MAYSKKSIVLSPRIRNLISILAFTSIIVLLSVSYSLNTVSANPSKTGYGISSKDSGCREGGIHNNDAAQPEYVTVYPPPAMPDSTDNTQMEITGTVEKALVSPIDAPWNHFSHDANWKVILDRDMGKLNAISTDPTKQANEPIPGKPKGSTDPLDKMMEMEWEIGTTNDGSDDRFPKEFWPTEGDRVWMVGRYIFDCGHPPPRTELHPANAVAFTHFEPMRIPSGGSSIVMAAKTSVYIHGGGGVYDHPVGGRHYKIFVDLPPKPSPTSKLVYIVNPVFGTAPKVADVYGAPLTNSGPSDNTILIDYDLTNEQPSSNIRRGAHIAAGWTDPAQSNVYHELKVTFKSIHLDSLKSKIGGDSYWEHLWANVNGQYIELLDTKTRFRCGFGLAPPCDDKALSPTKTVTTIVAEQGLSSKLNIYTTGYITLFPLDTCFLPGRDYQWNFDNTGGGSLSNRDFGAVINCGDPGDDSFIDNIKYSFPTNNFLKPTSLPLRDQTGLSWTLVTDIQDISGPISIATTPSPTPSPTSPSPNPSSCDPKSPTLRIGKDGAIGSRGPKVTELQQDLTRLGYGNLLGAPAIDGKFGPNTESAVKKLQQDNHLKIDGIVGPQTWSTICKLLSSVNPTNMVKETRDFYHQIALGQETTSNTPQITTSGTDLLQKYSVPAEEEEIESDLPFYPGLVNLTKADIVAIQTEPSPVENASEAELSSVENAIQPVSDANTTAALGEQIQQPLLCADGNIPAPTTGLCSDGSQPQGFNLNVVPAEQQQQLVCADGTSPDPSTSICADGSQAQSQNASAIPAEQQQQLVCADGSTPDPSTSLCADGSQPQPAAPGVPISGQQQQFFCADGSTPDPSTRLCADGTQPQPASPTMTTPSETEQLVCADDTASDVTTGLCADGSQPQAFNATAFPTEQLQPLACADGNIPDPSTGLCSDGSQPQPAAPVAASPSESEQQLTCADGNIPDPSTGLCSDGSQPQPAAPTTTIPSETEQQLTCADGTAPDVTTGLCADGSQPQPAAPTTTIPSETEQQLPCAGGSLPDSTTGLCADGSQPS